jgi:hypothetical protein
MKKVFLLAAVLFGANSVRSQWEPDVRLTNDPGASYTSYNNAWNIATSGDTVHAVWYDDRSGHNEIFYKRSLDAGISWSSDTQLTNNTNESQEPSIAVFFGIMIRMGRMKYTISVQPMVVQPGVQIHD